MGSLRVRLNRSNDGAHTGELWKDVLQTGLVKTPDLIKRLLLLLAHQAGSEVSVNEPAGQLQMTRPAVHGCQPRLDGGSGIRPDARPWGARSGWVFCPRGRSDRLRRAENSRTMVAGPRLGEWGAS